MIFQTKSILNRSFSIWKNNFYFVYSICSPADAGLFFIARDFTVILNKFLAACDKKFCIKYFNTVTNVTMRKKNLKNDYSFRL